MARKATTSKAAAKRPQTKTAAKAKPKPKAVRKPAGRKAAAKPAATRKAAGKKRAAKTTTPAATDAKKAARKAPPARTAGAKKASARKKAGRETKAARKAASERPAAGPKAAAKPKPKPKRRRSPYTRTQLKPMRVALLTLRARLVGDIDLMGREALRADEADVDAENMADHGTDAFERNMTLELMENESRTLRRIDSALETMEDGCYGLCTECGEGIPLARLEALPFAQTCVPCQEVQERLP